MNGSLEGIHLAWHGPLSLVSASDAPCYRDDAIAAGQYGMYLWTLPIGGSYLVNYVGKVYGGNSTRTFTTRFSEELDYERRRGLCVDVDMFFEGIRRKVEWHFDRVEDVLSSYRVFVAPLENLGDAAFLEIEASIINALHDADSRCSSFLANPRRRKWFSGTITMDTPANLLGLDVFTKEFQESQEVGVAKSVNSSILPASVPALQVSMERREMAKQVLERARNHDSMFGDWLWGNYVVEFSSDCGIEIQKPEGEGKRDGRNPYRLAFSKCIREVIPSTDYNYRVLTERIDHVIEAILRFHRRL